MTNSNSNDCRCDFGAKRAANVLSGTGSRFVRSDPNQLLAEIGALEQSDEGRRGAVETLSDELTILELALATPLRQFAKKARMPWREIADDESANGEPFRQHGSHQR